MNIDNSDVRLRAMVSLKYAIQALEEAHRRLEWPNKIPDALRMVHRVYTTMAEVAADLESAQ